MMKRLLSLLLCMVMVLSMVPVQAIAQETGEEPAELIPEAEFVEAETAPAEEIPISTEVVTEPIEKTTVPTVVEEVVAETTGSDVAMAAVASGTCGDNLTWVLDDAGILTISGIGEMVNSSFPWTTNRQSIKTVIVESGVTSIGKSAFSNCSNLSKVVLPDSILQIGQHAFSECSSLSDIYLPKGLASIGDRAFYKCTSLSSIALPGTVTSIGNLFIGCSSLREIKVAEDSEWYYDVDGVLFSYNNNYNDQSTLCCYPGGLQGNYTMPDNVTAINGYAFSYCTGLNSIILSDSIKSIRNFAFIGCTGITNIELPEGITVIETSVFSECKNLDNIKLPNSLTVIRGNAFSGCSSLSSITIPSGVVTLGDGVFYNSGLNGIILPESITSIGNRLFSNCSRLNNVTIPKSITSIGNNAFAYCTSLSEINFTGSKDQWITLLENSGTGNDPLLNVENIHFTGSVETEPSKPTEPSNPTEPEETTLSGTCGDNATWTFDQQTGVLTISGLGGIKNYKDPRDIYAYGDDLAPWNSFSSQIKEIKIESPISSIGDYAFSECSAVRILRLPVSVKSVGRYAFRSAGYLTDIYYEGTDAQWRTLCSNLKTGNTPLSGTSVTLHTNWKEPVDTVSGSCGDNVVWILNLTTGELKISGSGPMHNYWGAPGQYQPEPNYTPWCDYYLSVESVIIEPGVTSIGSYSFARCSKLVEVTIADTVESIGHYAFDSCVNLSDVYYTGSEEQWNQIEISETGNDPLHNSSSVTIWYNWTGEAPEPVYLQTVLYYHSWDKTANEIYFGADAEISFRITEETDVSSISDLFVRRYVVVQTRKEGDQEIFLKMELPKTAVGTVTAVNKSQITIDGETFTTPVDLTSRESYLNTQVVYHVYYSNLAGIEILNNRRGYLTRWDSADRELRIQASSESFEYRRYHLAYQAEDDSKTFLSWSVDENGQTDVTVSYLVDSNRVVYQILPVVARRADGFSAEKHGWPIVNTRASYGYPDGKYEYDWLTYYAHGIGFSNLEGIFPHKPNYSGNCFGLALLSIAQYNGNVDLKPYFNTAGDTLNEFGYDSIHDLGKDRGNGLVLHFYDDGNKIIHNNIIKKIEQAQGSQHSPEVTSTKKFFTVTALYEYLNEDHAKPMILSFAGDGHAVVCDTSLKPIPIGNNRYIILIYDPNSPHTPVEVDNLCKTYNKQNIMMLDLNNNWWAYNPTKDNISKAILGLECFEISKLDQEFYGDHYTFRMPADETIILFDTEEIVIEYIESGDKVFEMIDYKTWVNDQITYLPFIAEDVIKNTMKGCVILPKGNYIVKTKGESYVQYMYDDDIFVYGSDRDTEAMVDTQKDEMTVKNLGEESEVQCIYASSKVDFCTGVEARLSSGKSASLRTNSANKTASVATSAGAGSVTVIHVVDGEEVENTSNMIHYHDELTVLEGFEATCTETGLTDGRKCSSCGEITVPQQVIAATGHNYQNGACAKCGAIEYTYGQNVQIKLIEPWGIRANAKISTSAGVVDYDSLYDYGVYFIRKSALDRTGLTQSTITVADILNDTDARKMTKADGVTVSSGYLSAIYDSDIYTYELDDSVFVMFYFVTEEGADPIYVPVRERNLKTLAQQRMNDAASFPNDLERDVYKKMVTLEADVTDYRSDFTALSKPEMQKAPTLAQYPLGAAAANSSYTYGQNAQIKLIEPWGLKANVKVSLNGRVIDYSTVEEYGMVVLADNSRAYTDAAEILQNENAYVFSSKNGDASIAGGYISATYSKDIYTYQLNTDIYVFGYVKDSDGYHYGPVRNRNVHDLMIVRKDDAANFLNVKERTVYADMIDLYNSITAYREDYFKN